MSRGALTLAATVAAGALALASCALSPASPPGATGGAAAGTSAAAPPSSVPARRPTGRPGKPAVTLPDPATVNRGSPDAAAAAALTALYSYDTALDYGPADAAQRALPWLTQDFASSIRSTRPVAAPGAEWTTWTRHRATVTPTITAGHDQRPVDTATSAYRQYRLQLTAHGRDGWSGPASRMVVFVALVRIGGVWALDQILLQ